MSATPAQAAQERDCLFERQIVNGITNVVRLPVAMAWTGSRSRVAVQGSGTYDGTARTASNGGMEVVFRSPVSTETLTIGPGGETLWTIAFDDGRTMIYAGFCGPVRAQ